MANTDAATAGSPFTAQPRQAPVRVLDRALATTLQRRIGPVGVNLRLWDGSCWPASATPAAGTLDVSDRGTLLGLVVNPDLAFGDAYTTGRLQVSDGLLPVVEALSRMGPRLPDWRDRIAAALAVANTLTASRRNVQHHYDLGNDFYRIWLDKQLVYTCAFFDQDDVSLEEAQIRKLDLVCRKLDLRPGETVVEAGCGWGALALHMARHYGARVKAFNISSEQLAFARERAVREGLDDRVEFIDDDYRNVSGQFDAFVSVGMLEHVGRKYLSALASVLTRTVRPDGGRGLLHFIGRDVPQPLNPWIRRRIFPGAYPPALAEVASQVLGPAGMSIVDVENLRLHYARTLAHWSQRFAASRDTVRARFGEEFQRAWELYLAGSEAAFRTGWLQLFQIVFIPAGSRPPFERRAQL